MTLTKVGNFGCGGNSIFSGLRLDTDFDSLSVREIFDGLLVDLVTLFDDLFSLLVDLVALLVDFFILLDDSITLLVDSFTLLELEISVFSAVVLPLSFCRFESGSDDSASFLGFFRFQHSVSKEMKNKII